MSLVQTVAPQVLPVSIDDAMQHCRVDGQYEAEKINLLVRAATKYAEEYQWSQLISATWQQRMDRFPCGAIELQKNPVSSVTSVAYTDTAGASQTLTASTDYTTDVNSKPARIVPAYSKWWPTTRGHIDDVVVTFIAGFGTSESNVPETTRQAIMLLVGHWYANREGVLVGQASKEIEFAVKALLDLNSYRAFY